MVVVGRLDQKMPGPIFCPSPALAVWFCSGQKLPAIHAACHEWAGRAAIIITPRGLTEQNKADIINVLNDI